MMKAVRLAYSLCNSIDYYSTHISECVTGAHVPAVSPLSAWPTSLPDQSRADIGDYLSCRKHVTKGNDTIWDDITHLTSHIIINYYLPIS